MVDGYVGRDLTLTFGGTTVVGARARNLTFNGSELDVTSAENTGKRTLLEASGVESIDIAIDGVVKGTLLKRIAGNAGTRIQAVVITFPDGDQISGNFRLGNFTEGNPHDNAVTFSATLMSTGAWTYTPASS